MSRARLGALLALAGLAVAASALLASRGAAGDTLRLVAASPDRGPAPPLALGHLPTSGRGAGRMYDLKRDRGRKVLLYFRERVECDACWAQQRLLERTGSLRRLGVQRVVSIIRDPLRIVRDAGAGNSARLPLSDVGGSVFSSYGLPVAGRRGHSFVLVGRDGRIEGRADYVADAMVSRPVALPALARALRR